MIECYKEIIKHLLVWKEVKKVHTFFFNSKN
jgi:hypothetical protein